MQERLERVPFPRPVHVSIPHDARSHRFVAGNLSAGGMFVRGEPRPPAGTPLQVSLEAKGKVFPFAEAEVVWSAESEAWAREGRTPGFGLRFTRFLHPRSQTLIDHLLGRNRPALPPEVGEQLVGEPEPEALAGPPPGFMQQPLEELTPSQFGVPVTRRPPGAPPLEVALEPEPDAFLVGAAPRDGAARVGMAVALVALLVGVGAGGVHFARRDNAAMPPPPGQKVIAAPARPVAPPAPVAEVPPPEAEPVVALAVEVAVEAPPVAPQPQVPAPAQVRLPSGAATSVAWREVGGALEVTLSLAEGAEVERAFALSAPARLVIDLAHVSPTGSARVESADARVTAVRVGAREGGTRLVLDLSVAAGKVERDGDLVRVALVR